MSALTVADVLSKAADLIEPEGAWLNNGMYSANAEKSSVDPLDPNATCFCAMGAVYRAAGVSSWRKTGPVDLVAAARKHLADMLGIAMAMWNDDPQRTQAEVVAALRSAAALARTEPERHPS